jgi:uncharacterized coiled-coil protein SlyX
VYLNEDRVNDVLMPFIGESLFGTDRVDYWRTCLEASNDPGKAAPAAARAKEITADIADLERRIARQLITLEEEDATPALLRRVSQRIEELEATVAERNESLAVLVAQSATEAPEISDVAALLNRLPILASGLATAPQPELRELFEKLQLNIAYQPEAQVLDVEITLYQDAWNDIQGQPHLRAEDQLAPPAGLDAVLRKIVRLKHRFELR